MQGPSNPDLHQPTPEEVFRGIKLRHGIILGEDIEGPTQKIAMGVIVEVPADWNPRGVWAGPAIAIEYYGDGDPAAENDEPLEYLLKMVQVTASSGLGLEQVDRHHDLKPSEDDD